MDDVLTLAQTEADLRETEAELYRLECADSFVSRNPGYHALKAVARGLTTRIETLRAEIDRVPG